jgi:thiamine pyrophosphokinase
MKLPVSLAHSKEWTLVGPMGPQVPEGLVTHSLLSVDGGARFTSHMDIWIGDGDSYTENVNCQNIFRFPPQKSHSDFSLALSLFTTLDSLVLHCWGFLGGRKDHEIFNFGEVLRFLETSPNTEVYFYESNGKVAAKCFGRGEWSLNYQGTFSLACIKSVKIKLSGACEYSLENETELGPLSSLGLSNSASGVFTLVNQGPIIIFFPELT